MDPKPTVIWKMPEVAHGLYCLRNLKAPPGRQKSGKAGEHSHTQRDKERGKDGGNHSKGDSNMELKGTCDFVVH
jgi:hypothetical protein